MAVQFLVKLCSSEKRLACKTLIVLSLVEDTYRLQGFDRRRRWVVVLQHNFLRSFVLREKVALLQ